MAKIIGIDDAGRGPVIGPMVLAGIMITEKDKDLIKSLGAKDSKVLTPLMRKTIAKKIHELKFPHKIETSSPQEIDESENLNYLEAIKTAKIINHLVKGTKEKEKIAVVIDCPSPNIKSWTSDVEFLLDKPDKVCLQCEHKADANHAVVSAASILAKEKREEEVAKIKEEYKIEFGSGYCADPRLKEFIKENFDNKKYAEIIRHSWSTVKRLVEEKNPTQKKLF